tara:strand:- start:810 stop:1733 length:924 start_codon:yes stop_codon:yes gene_type:complete
MLRSHKLRASLASSSSGGGGGGSYTSGTFYPIFAVKLFAASSSEKTDISSNPANSSKIEQPLQRALSFDTSNTTGLNGTETTSAILTICDTSYYTCNSDFGTGGETISAIKIIHYDTSKTLKNQGEFAFNGSSFNIYDHACNVLPSTYNTSSSNFDHPSQLGTITSASLDGTSITPASGKTLKNHILVNVSTYAGGSGGNNYSSWSNDSGDYCFLGITDKGTHANSTDGLDTGFATTKGLAFGISDSDGRASVLPATTQYPPKTINYGINRRNSGYHSLHTNWTQRDVTSHSGNTTSGYFVVYGKVN